LRRRRLRVRQCADRRPPRRDEHRRNRACGDSLVLMPWLGRAKQRIGTRIGSTATASEGKQNLLCAYLAGAVLIGLLGNTLFGA
jgi:hypothetical protein